MGVKKRIIVIDSNILIHRAYHALPPLKNKNGELTNAVYGFFLIFFRAIKEFQPNYVVAVFDTKKPTFRHKEFDGYKMNRPPTPEALSAQIPMIQSILKESGISIFEKEGFEADDIIGTVTRLSLNEKENDLEVIILSCDLDTLQLINGNVKVCALKKGFSNMVLYDPEAVENRYQLIPSKLIDYRALKGDPSDNIPGVAGIGEKTAIKLISSFGSLGNLYNEIKASSAKAKKIQPSLLQKLIDNEDRAWLSRRLSIIDQEVPIDFQLEDCGFGNYDREKAAHSLEGIGFRSLISKLP